MATSFRKFLEGLRIVPKTTSTASEQGDLDVTSADGKLNYYNGTSASPVVTEAHQATLSNKTIDTAATNTIKINGNTLSASSGTATVTVPNSTDTLVGRATSDTLTNKTIDGDDNTIQDVGISSLKTVLADANKVIRRNASGAVVSDNSIPNSSALVTTDSSSVLTNKTIDGDDNTIQDVGISSLKTVLADANKAIIRDASGAVVSDYIADVNVKSNAAIARTKIASGTANHVIINDASGVLSSEASLAISRGGTGQATQAAGFNALSPLTTAGDVIVHDGTNNVRLARGTDGQVLVVDNNQTNKLKWTILQQGAKNYILYGTFENNDAITGWSLARSTLDATTKLPNQTAASWTSAAGTLSKSIVSSGQLAGSYSLSLASSGATTAGDMLVTDALTLDLEAQASVQTFSFFYKVVSGAANGNFSGTSSNSIGVAIYVVDGALAGTWIQPAGVFNIVQSSGVGKAAGTFQVPNDATQVRLAVYFPNATTGAITVYLDDFVLGPQVVQYGAAVTEWKDWTPTGTWVTNATYTGKYRIVGDIMEFRVNVACSGAVTATGLAINLPGGFSIDTSKLVQFTAGVGSLGYGSALNAGTSFHGLLVNYGNTTSVGVYVGNTAGTYITNGNVSATVPFTFGAGDAVDLVFSAPILGLGATVQMSNNTDTRVVATRRTGATAVSFGADTLVTFSATASPDTHGGWVSSSQYTVPVSGIYKISAAVLTNAYTLSTTGALQVYYRVNNGASNRLGWATGNGVSTSQFAEGTDLISLNAGDAITFRVSSSNTATLAEGLATIQRISGPSAIASSESVMARYSTASAQALTTSPAIINFATVSYDTHGAVTTGASWKFTAPIAGKYRVTSRFLTAAGTTAMRISYDLNKNGIAQTTPVTGTQQTTSSNRIDGSGSDTIQLNAGDYIDIRGSCSTGSNSLAGDAPTNFVVIERIGN